MRSVQRYESEWEGLRLVVEARSDYWRAFVYDLSACEVLYTAERMTLDAAKFVAIEFVATAIFGGNHGLNPDVIAEMLVWKES